MDARRQRKDGTKEGQGGLWTVPFVVIVCCSLFSFLMGQSANAGTSVYLDRMGEATSLAGVGAMVFSFAAAAGRIATGPAVDGLGRAMFMVIGSVIMAIGSCGPLFDGTNSLFVLWRLLQGLGFSICTTACATAAADVLPLDRMGEGIGYYGLGQAISMTIGPALAILLISTDFPESFYIALAAFAALALVCSLCCRYERDPSSLPEGSEYRMRFESGEVPVDGSGSREREGRRTRRLSPRDVLDSVFEPPALRGAVPMMFVSVAYGFGIFFVGVFGTSIGASSPGAFFTVAAVTMIAVRLVSGRFMDRLRPIAIMGVAVACALAVYGTFLYCDIAAPPGVAEWLYYPAGLLYGVSIGVAIPINQTVAVKVSSPERWGAANGLFLLANDLAIGVTAFVCGITIESIGYAFTFVGVMACVAVSFVVALMLYPRESV